MGLLNKKPLWLDNAHLQPCDGRFEFEKLYSSLENNQVSCAVTAQS